MNDSTRDQAPAAIYRRLLRYSFPHWKVFLGASIASALFSLTEVSFIALMKPLVDGTFVDRDPAIIRVMPFAILGLFLARGVTGFASAYGMAWIARQVIKTLRGQLFNHLLLLPVRFFEQQSSGQLITRVTYHVDQVAAAATTVLTTTLKNTLTVVGLIILMLTLNWQLTLFCLVVGPLIALVIRYVSRRFRTISRRIQQSMGNVTEATEEAVTAHRVIKIHNGQDIERRQFEEINERHRYLSLKTTATSATSDAVIQFIAAIAVAAIVYVAGRPEMLAEITPGVFVAFVGAMLSLMNPIKGLTAVNEKLQRGISAATEIFRLMDQAPEMAGGTRALERARGRVEFRDVRFSYGEGLGEALRGVSVAIEPGQTVAFVGRSGSGKSTLLSLLPRFYDPSAGAIHLDGHPLADYPLDRLRAQIALVDQHVRLFNATIGENIAYGLDPPPDEARIVEAARAAFAWEFIEKLPGQLKAQIGQNGVMLSGGQRQRIAIARALLRNAPILILDEATSALDTESERYIQAALEKLVQGRTTLVIAHRLSTVQRADKIVVLQEGRVAEVGRHEELLSRGGLYAALYQMQFED